MCKFKYNIKENLKLNYKFHINTCVLVCVDVNFKMNHINHRNLHKYRRGILGWMIYSRCGLTPKGIEMLNY